MSLESLLLDVLPPFVGSVVGSSAVVLVRVRAVARREIQKALKRPTERIANLEAAQTFTRGEVNKLRRVINE